MMVTPSCPRWTTDITLDITPAPGIGTARIHSSPSVLLIRAGADSLP